MFSSVRKRGLYCGKVFCGAPSYVHICHRSVAACPNSPPIMARACVCITSLLFVTLVGFCLLKEHTSDVSYAHQMTNAVCKQLFHYGVFDLPISCRYQVSTVANLATDVGQYTKNYERLEYLPIGSTPEAVSIVELSDQKPSLSPSIMDVEASNDFGFSNLYPAVIECFSIIICGYAAGRSHLISPTEGRGLGSFVGSFALPAMIFLSMAKLDFRSVNWTFLLAIFISKTMVFFIVAIVILIVYRKKEYGKAGLFAIFCTQSNDFALGYPIVAALYSKTHPEFAAYLYLVAPISLVFLNPIGFVLMEIGKRLSPATDGESAGAVEGRCTTVYNILKDILLNPVVFMTALGMAANYLFNHQLPNIIEGILTVLGQSFSATALFMLGLMMVGKVQSLRGAGLVAPGILIVIKTLVLPLVCREVVSFLKPGVNINETMAFSNYGFLYGTFPTAPSVFVFAAQYNVAIDMIASAMVACTFLSAPLMFVSAKMIGLSRVDPNDYVTELESFLFYVSLVGIVCTIWTVFVFLLSKKWKKVPHFITLCLTISQFIACVGALLWSVSDGSNSFRLYLQFVLFTFGSYSARIWTAILAVTLFLLRWRSVSFVLQLRPIFAIVGWGLPAIVVVTLTLVMQHETDLADRHDPNFHFGSTQAVVSLLLLWFCFFTTIVCLILHKRYEKRYAEYESLRNVDDGEDGIDRSPVSPRRRGLSESDSVMEGEISTSVSIEENGSENDSLFCYNDDLLSRGSTNREAKSLTRRQLTEPQEEAIVRDRDDEFHLLRHVVLLLLLSASMIVGCALCMWTLFSKEVNGVYVELIFLDVVLNFGQGFFTATVFGLDTKRIFVTLRRSWRKIFYGTGALRIPQPDKLDRLSKQTCDQFVNYHMDKCIHDLVRNRSWRLRRLTSVFCGNELVDWLLLVGLAHDRTDAIKYGRGLLQGGIMRHVDNLHHFHDQPLFYCFNQT